MITKIEVDGFKSLKDFSLEFQPGLNILVGPNGAGKTNIILFMELLARSTHTPIDKVVNDLGGAGVIFHKTGEEIYSDTIKARISGTVSIGQEEENKTFYEYAFTVKRENLFFLKQELKIRYTKSKHIGLENEWDTHFLTEAIDAKGAYPIKVLHDKTNDFPSLKTQIIQANPNLSLLTPFIYSKPIFFFLFDDLAANLNLSIIPDMVRKPDDAASQPGIHSDGSNIASTLYALNMGILPNHKEKIDDDVKFINSSIFTQIERHLQNANSAIIKMEVDKSNFYNQLVVKITLKSNGYSVVLPLSSMSDGTVKWLALITAIYTSPFGISIEEPENFLHPWMQAEILTLLREHVEEKVVPTFSLITTHGESLLNEAKPEEIILVDFKDGRTVTRRIENIKGVKEEISNSGLGLGHFYFSNILASA